MERPPPTIPANAASVSDLNVGGLTKKSLCDLGSFCNSIVSDFFFCSIGVDIKNGNRIVVVFRFFLSSFRSKPRSVAARCNVGESVNFIESRGFDLVINHRFCSIGVDM